MSKMVKTQERITPVDRDLDEPMAQMLFVLKGRSFCQQLHKGILEAILGVGIVLQTHHTRACHRLRILAHNVFLRQSGVQPCHLSPSLIRYNAPPHQIVTNNTNYALQIKNYKTPLALTRAAEYNKSIQ